MLADGVFSGRPIGVMGAMPEEVSALEAEMDVVETVERGMRRYLLGTLFGVEAVLLFCRIGKVAAASSATHLISDFGVRSIVFTGVAGGVSPEAHVGDLVVATELCQHDMDASPIFPPMEAPLLGRARFDADPAIAAALVEAAGACAAEDMPGVLTGHADRPPRVHTGLVISGDRFVSTAAEVRALRERVPDAVCVEMEGAAVAQVCHEHGLPFGVVRAISDSADDDAAEHFGASLAKLAPAASLGVLRRALPPIAAAGA